MSLTHVLPAPSHPFKPLSTPHTDKLNQLVHVRKEPPPYGHRVGFVPRSLDDFGDGGAFPEIHVAQYPLNMGRNLNAQDSKANVVTMQIDKEGHIKYDAIAYQGQRSNKVIHTHPKDALPTNLSKSEVSTELARPSQEDIDKTTEETRKALEKIVQAKITAAQPTQVAEKKAPVQYIRYTPSQQGEQFNSGAKQRLIHMMEMQKDPMEPPKFSVNKKIPRGPPSPPVPILHSPTRKVTAKEQQDWRVPPCISSWKNPRGFTNPLDKRLVADGRDLQEPQINENFSRLAHALYAADRNAREAIEMRYQIEKKVEEKIKTERDEELKGLAQIARDIRAGIKTVPVEDNERDEVNEREAIRRERQEDRIRENRLTKVGKERSKGVRDKDRDISEKIALGMPAKSTGPDALYDTRLFEQNRGVNTGFGMDDEVYNVYNEPWRQNNSLAAKIYRPRKDVDQEIYGGGENSNGGIGKRFEADKPFSGAHSEVGRTENGPVQFTKDSDPFGITKYLQSVKRSGEDIDKDSKRAKK